MSAKITVARVYKITEGSALTADITAGSPATGGRLGVEAVTDFDIPTDGETRTVVIDSEQITYTDVDEDTDELTGITRGANSTTAASHTGGTFVQYGTTAKKHKLADGFIDDDDSMAIGVEILRHLWRFYPVGARENDQMEIASLEFLDDGHPIIVDAPEDEDRATTPVVLPFTKLGTLGTGTRAPGHPMPFGGSIEEVRARVNTAPTGASIIIDVLVDGVSILTTKPTITAGSTLSAAVEPTNKFHEKSSSADHNIIQIEVEQVGSTVAGADLTVYLTVFPSEDAVAGRIEIEGPQGPAGADGADGTDGVISEVQNEGTALADQGTMNFTGAGVDVTVAGGKYVVNVPGATGSFEGTRAYRATSSQSIATATETAVQLNAESYDVSGWHDNATNNTRVTPGKTGYFEVHAGTRFAANGTGARSLRVKKNGTTRVLLGGPEPTVGASEVHVVNASDTIRLDNASDYLELYAYQTSGGNLDVAADDSASFLTVIFRGPL